MVRLFCQFLSGKHLLLRDSPFRVSGENSNRPPARPIPFPSSVPSLSYPLLGQRPACGARFFRSPDRLPGLLDAGRRTGRLRSFTLEDALYLSYLRDFRFALLFSLCLGFSLWWVLATEPLFAYPPTCISGYCAQLLKEVPLCEGRILNLPCFHPNGIHDLLSKIFIKPDENFDTIHLYSHSRIDPAVVDPFSFLFSNRAISLVAMLGAIVLTVALGESFTTEGLLV